MQLPRLEPMPSLSDLRSAYVRLTTATRDQLVEFGTTVWEQLPDYRDANINAFVSAVAPRVRASQIRVAQLTAALLREQGGSPAVARAVLSQMRSVPVEEEYRRPAVQVYTELAAGKSFDESVKAGLDRLVSLLTTDVQLAKTHQARASLAGSGFRYYRRVLTGMENCALCTIASTQRYHVADLMPIHPGCDCGIEAVDAGWDPGQVLDSQLLEDTHLRVQESAGFQDRGGRDPDYRDLIVTHEHGDLGPVLAWRSDEFTGPSDI